MKWSEITNMKMIDNKIKCTSMCSINNIRLTQEEKPVDYFMLMMNQNLLNVIVSRTNEYGQIQKEKAIQNKETNKRVVKWRDTSLNEIKQFLAVVLYMGLVHLPSIPDYWSRSPLYCNKIIPSIISRNRFQILLNSIHFGSLKEDKTNKLWKVQESLDIIKKTIKESRIPGKNLVVDESIVPYQGRLGIKQYLPAKRHRFGIKLFKICDEVGYIYDFIVCKGKENEEKKKNNLSFRVVEVLSRDYLGVGRCIVTDNYYTSIY